MYVEKIKLLLKRMRDAIHKVHPRNRQHVDDYFGTTWWWVGALIMGLPQDDVMNDQPSTTSIDRFQEYIDWEEQRISENLQKIKYNIDASDTLFLVLGPGRLEKVRVCNSHGMGDC